MLAVGTATTAGGNVGIGTTSPGAKLVVTDNANGQDATFKVNHTRSDSNVATQAIEVDMNLSGADTTTGDKSSSGVRVDIDSTANGDASNEHRIYGVFSTVNFTGFTDIARGGYFLAESNYTSAKTQQLAGVYGQATHDSNNTSGGVSNMFGVYGISVVEDLGDVDNAFGGYFQVELGNNRGAANFGVTKGVEGHVNINKAATVSYDSMTAVSAVIDNNEGSTPNFGSQFLFKGDYQGDKGPTAWGIYCEGDKHYLAGNLGVGLTSPTQVLHVAGNARVTGAYYDSNNSPGTANQVLVSTATGTDWVDGSGSSIIGGPYLPLAGGTMTAGAVVTFLDSSGSTDDRLKFGTGGDMQLFHDGTASHIVSSGSDLRIDVPNFIVRSASGAESIIRASQNAAVELYYNNTKKFETTSTGIEVSGTSSTFAGTLTVQGAGAASYGSLSLVSSDSFIRLNTTGGTADKRKWDIRTISASGYEGLEFRTVNDANDVFSTKLSIAHGGNATFTGSVTIPNYIIHASDPNTFFGFDNNDQVAIKTSGNYNFFGDSTATTLYAAGGAKLKTTHVSVGTATTAGGTLIDGWKTTTQANAINDTTIATTAYVNNKIALIPAGLVFQGTWNASTNTPTLTSGSGTTGNFYIVSVAGSTNLDGITDWKVGDWAVFIEQGASDQWEKIDNSSVLDGFGTGQSVTKWDGSGTSNTLTNGPITFSGNDSTFAGDITLDDDLNFSTNGFADISNTGTGAMRFKPSSQTLALTLTGVNATFAGDVNMASAKIESDGSAAAGAYLELHHNNNNSTDVCATINLTNNAGGYASIIGGTTGANNTGYIEFKTDNAGTQGTVLTLTWR